METRCGYSLTTHLSVDAVPLHLDCTEEVKEQMKSILAQMDYTYQVRRWTEGVPFCSHLYVPEVHPETGAEFHEREDEGHVFKVRVA